MSPEGPPPTLPPRPETISPLDDGQNTFASPMRQSTKQNLQSKATTALSLMEISSQPNVDDSKDVYDFGFTPSLLGKRLKAKTSLSQLTSARGCDIGDSASVRSYQLNPERLEEDSIFGDVTQTGFNCNPSLVDDKDDGFEDEFEPVGELAADRHNEGL
jgi:vacuolar fusion protein MON1